MRIFEKIFEKKYCKAKVNYNDENNCRGGSNQTACSCEIDPGNLAILPAPKRARRRGWKRIHAAHDFHKVKKENIQRN